MSDLRKIPRSIDVIRNSKSHEIEMEKVNVVGPYCSSLNCIGSSVSLGKVEIGDVLVVPNVEAYELTASLMHNSSFPLPKEIVYRNNLCLAVYRRNFMLQDIPLGTSVNI